MLNLFAAAHARNPSAMALLTGNLRLTYDNVDARSDRFAAELQKLHIAPGSVVGIVLPRSADLVCAILGVLKTGAAYLPIDPANPPARIEFMLADAHVVGVVGSNDTKDKLPGNILSLLVETIDFSVCHPRRPAREQNLAYVIYTSGTTGLPKGAAISNAALPALAEAQRVAYEISADSIVLQISSPGFDAMVIELLMAWAAGAALAIAPPGPVLGEDLESIINEARVTHALITPAALGSLPAEAALPTLRTLVVGGEACSGALVARWSAGRRMINAYGPTETTACITMSAPLSGSVTPPIGRPIAGVRVLVLDATLQPVPVGVPGELYVAGACLGMFYIGRSSLTAERFVACPYGPPGARMYRTGDLVRWRSDRTLDYIGRSDQQVKLRGVRIELGEIEASLARLPGIAAAAAAIREDRPGDPRLVAYVVTRDGAVVDAIRLRRQLAAHLPEQSLPSAFVQLAALPLTASGKLDRRALPSPHCQGVKPARPPVTKTELAICALFSEALGRPDIDLDTNFFEFGGHSLLAIKLGRRIRDTLSPKFPIAGIYAAPNVGELAAIIDYDAAPASEGMPDLTADLHLPPRIVAAAQSLATQQRPPLPRGMRRVFLTGATGFVGGHLLASLLRDTAAEVICHVRADTPEAASNRLAASLRAKHLDAASDNDRVTILPGNLASASLGLDPDGIASIRDSVDTIFHCGAAVDFLHPYASLKAANVDSLLTLLQWVAEGGKRLHHISTLGVFDMSQGSGPIHETDPLAHWEGLVGGYSRSKYVADALARRALAAGLPVSIHRLGSVTGDHTHALCNDADFIWRLARFSAGLGALPALDLALNLTPVDDVARAIVRLADAEARGGAVYHLLSTHTPDLVDLGSAFAGLGVPMRFLEPDAWAELAMARAAESDDAEVGAILAIAAQHGGVASGRVISASATQARLRSLDAMIRPVDADLLMRYLQGVVGRKSRQPPLATVG